MANQLLITPEFTARFCEYAKLGMKDRHICAKLHFSQDTLCMWKQRAAQGDEPYKTFCEAVAEARAEDAREMLEETKAAIRAKKDPKYYLKLLDVVHGVTETAKKKEVTVTGGLQIAPAFDVNKLTDEQFKNWCECLEAMKPTAPTMHDELREGSINLLPAPDED
jgi:hypothetical protein